MTLDLNSLRLFHYNKYFRSMHINKVFWTSHFNPLCTIVYPLKRISIRYPLTFYDTFVKSRWVLNFDTKNVLILSFRL
jgi:hypothetical protein